VIRLREFNQLDGAEAAALLRPCLDVRRWAAEIVAGRPYASVAELFSAARVVADPFTGAELEAALVHFPRLGEWVRGAMADGMSRSELAALVIDDDVRAQLAEGNRQYEHRFGRIFLIRAAGRSSAEILAKLQTRLGNDIETEDRVVTDQLRQIALIRLAGVVSE
jgi:2-oxo-4-hydroxy-4-carboxy-5-ureidoimidazoline decarboxylase